MSNWKSTLKADPIHWLLEKDNPSVRYFTLTDILDKSENARAIKETKQEIMESGVVPNILAKQTDEGYWGMAENFYIRAKYKGTVWQLITLAELEADGNDERIKRACEFILRNSQDRQNGGFSTRGNEASGGQHNEVIPCLTGNMVWSLLRFGYLEDPRVQQGIDWITSYQRFDDGIKERPKGRESCWGKHTCHMGVVKALKALAEIPPDPRAKEVKSTIEQGAEYLLKHHVHKRSHDLTQIARPRWVKFGFPLMWNIDALEILQVLTKLGYQDKRMQEAIDLVISKQDDQGRWKLETTFNGRVQVDIEQKGKPSKWVTLNALRVLKRFI